MPVVTVVTNLSKGALPDDFPKGLVCVVADIMGRPTDAITWILQRNMNMSMV